MSDYIIEMKNITKRFPGIVANDNISLGIKKGEIFALLGENGAGKSTLMSMLFGMYEPDEGEFIIRGKKEHIVSPAYANQLNIGMVHQHFKLVSNYTVTENIILGMHKNAKFMGCIPYVDIKTAEKEVEELSKNYALNINPKDKIENLPISARQRVEILKMLYRKAEILIFDEPSAVLTPKEIEYLLEIIKGLRDSGKTIILITHKLEEIKKIADRCAILNKGRLIDILDVKTSTTKEMANLMVGREVNFNTEKKPASFSETILEVRDLCMVNHENLEIVKSVSFQIRRGEIFAIAGVAGNGQVDIADAITGLLPISSGSIYLNGKDITKDSIRQRSLAGISYIPEDRQSFGLVLDFSLEDNLALKDYFKEGFSKNSIIQRDTWGQHADTLIQKYDIRCAVGSKTDTRCMSGGNQQKAIIGREIELSSDLMVFVQPTRGLDIGAIENIHKQIIEQRDFGKAILLISLELDEVMDLADTIGVIYNGRMLKIAPADTMTEKEVGEYMMGVVEHA